MSQPLSKRSDRQIRNVLLVECPSTARERHMKTLARNGYRVVTADTVEEGRTHWVPQNFGLIVISLNGFGEAAASFCNELKNSDSEQLIALIFSPDQELPATDCP